MQEKRKAHTQQKMKKKYIWIIIMLVSLVFTLILAQKVGDSIYFLDGDCFDGKGNKIQGIKCDIKHYNEDMANMGALAMVSTIGSGFAYLFNARLGKK